jgi:hypothetical protein
MNAADRFIGTPDHSVDWARRRRADAWFNDRMRELDASSTASAYEVMSVYWPHGESNPQ